MQGTATEIIRETAATLEASLDTLVDDISRAIAQQVPEVLDGDSYRASNRANLRLKLAILRRCTDLTVPEAPHDAIVYARDLARRGADLSVLLRAYDLGHKLFWIEWTRRFADRTHDPAVLAELYEISARFLFAYFDAVPAAVTSAYREELAHPTDTGEARRAEAVCGLLGGLVGDVRAIERQLGYPLGSARHLALIHDEPDAGARPALVRLGRGLGAETLVVRAETQALWAWLALPSETDAGDLEQRLTALEPPRAGTLAIGDVGLGIDGFCDSHREAQLALRQSRGERRIVHYRDLGAASLLANDARRAQRFVERELGSLAASDDATMRVRATLLSYLQEQGNQARTARRLGIHVNTVAYRLRRAERLLGRPITHRRFDLEAALVLHARAVGR